MLIIIFFLMYIVNPFYFPLISAPLNLICNIPIIYTCFPKQIYLIHESVATRNNMIKLLLETLFMLLAYYENLLVVYHLIGLWIDYLIIYFNLENRFALRILYLSVSVYRFDYIYVLGMFIYLLNEIM